jgi:hypothetical protein
MSDNPQATQPAPPLSNYECTLCGFDQDLAPGDHWCPVCAEARGLDVLMTCTRIIEGDAACRQGEPARLARAGGSSGREA